MNAHIYCRKMNGETRAAVPPRFLLFCCYNQHLEMIYR